MEARRDVFQAIADPTRRAILGMVAEEPKNLNTIADGFSMSRQAISLHIKILSECGLLQVRQEGRERFCSLEAEKLEEVDEWLAPFRQLWETRFAQLDELLKKSSPKRQKRNAKTIHIKTRKS
jgi:DNA-binding transcriptional ArsR family regulator